MPVQLREARPGFDVPDGNGVVRGAWRKRERTRGKRGEADRTQQTGELARQQRFRWMEGSLEHGGSAARACGAAPLVRETDDAVDRVGVALRGGGEAVSAAQWLA